VLRAVAEEAAEAARRARGPCQVRGRGFIAAQVRQLLGLASEMPERPPAGRLGTIIDTTGDPDAISDATRDLADLGTLVLAGEAHGGFAFDFYPDVHVRGLRVVGIAPPLHDGLPPGSGREGDLVRAVREAQLSLRENDVIPEGALLYRVAS
jgi:threonine dehydrogenase-like Zn-dependent dehydrogenase